jgi:tetratricopeptide (TPR) repeat protein
VALGELSNPRANSPQTITAAQELVAERAREWRDSPTIWHAADLLNSALTIGQEGKFKDAAEFILSAKKNAPDGLIALATHAMGAQKTITPPQKPEDEDQIRRSIHFLRKRLREEPRNSICSVELARMYVLIGQYEKAEHAMQIACALDPQNRYIIRCASRLFVHGGNADVPLSLMRNSPATARDPWLLAAEISVSSAMKRPSLFVKRGKQVLEDASFTDFAKTELTSAVATLEMENGSAKRARQMFNASLTAPTENSVAQAQWASKYLPSIEISEENLSVPRSFEANALKFSNQGQWELALEAAQCWLADQPFSSRPAVMASYLSSSMLERYRQSIEILRRSLIANPRNPELTNNLAFAMANDGNVDEAAGILSTIDVAQVSGLPTITLSATKGLVLFRIGLIEIGRSQYQAAIERARGLGAEKYRILAALHLAMEEIRAETDEAQRSTKEALASVPDEAEPDVEVIAARLRALAEEKHIQYA